MKQKSIFSNNTQKPLAETLRPESLEQLLGQQKILMENSAFTNLLKSARPFSFILWGPPGCGKTSLASLVAKRFNAAFEKLSAVNSGLKDLKELIARAEGRKNSLGENTVVFIDEIHRYTKTQQDALLPYLEDGTIYLIGATTENPSFQVIPAVLSRLQVIMLEGLTKEDILDIIRKGYQYLMQQHGKITLDKEVGEFIAVRAGGDARTALNLVENSYFAAQDGKLDTVLLESLTQRRHVGYNIDEHYDLASALQKSIRGSDANAAIYWLARMISGGEDPRFIARRLIVTASEDIGLADPNALNIAISCFRAVEIIGMPEGRIPLANAVAYLAKANKSNQSYKAVDQALADIEKNGEYYPVPKHLRDAHYKDAANYGAGVGYLYSHNHPDEEQDFLPEELKDKKYI